MVSISSGHALFVAGIVSVFTLGRFSAGGTEDRHVETGYRRNVPVRQQALASPDDVLQLPTASALEGDGAHAAVLGDVPLLPRTQRAPRQSAVLPRTNTAPVDYGPEYETEEQALR